MLSDYSGRKPVLGIADIIFIGGAIAQAACHTVWAMIGGRFLIGVGVGLAACIAPLYIQELSPTRLRGRMVTLNVVAITGGQVIAYGIGAGFEHMHGGWRWMVGLGCVPAAIQLVLLVFLPESPRIVVRRGEEEIAVRIMRRIYAYASEEEVRAKVILLAEKVKEAREITESTTLAQRIYSIFFVPVNRRALSKL